MMPTSSNPAKRQAVQFLVFKVCEAILGIEIDRVSQISRNVTITGVYSAPVHVKGVTNLRGQIVTVLDLASRLGLAAAGIAHGQPMIVASAAGESVGLLVDELDDIVKVESKAIMPVPRHLPRALGSMAWGVFTSSENLVIALDVDRVVG